MENGLKRINTEKSSQLLQKIEPIENRIAKYIEGNFNLSRQCDTIDPVDGRFREKSISKIDDQILSMALTKLIVDTLEYYGSENTGMASMLMDDIKAEFGKWTLIDIFKAINMGRRGNSNVYGKLNASHFIKWLRDYDMFLSDKIVERQKNVAHKRRIGLDQLSVFNKELQELKNKINHNNEQKMIARQDRIPASKKEFQVFKVEEPSKKTILIREWLDIEGDKPTLEDYLKEKSENSESR